MNIVVLWQHLLSKVLFFFKPHMMEFVQRCLDKEI